MNILRKRDLYISARCEILGEKASGIKNGKIVVKNGKCSNPKQKKS
jgi:hypothetical protein